MAETIPDLTYGKVVGRFLAAVGDTTADADIYPDGVPLTGTVVFTPSASAILLQGVQSPVTVLPAPVTATLVDGWISYNSDLFVNLVSTDNIKMNPRNFTWSVEFKNLRVSGGSAVAYKGFAFMLPAGTTVDLSEVAPVPASGGIPILRGPAGSDGPAGPGFVTGGTTGQALVKLSNTDGDYGWGTVTGGGGGGGAVSSVASRTGAVTLTSADLTDATASGRAVVTAANAAAVAAAAGLPLVDNTRDASKPISTAQAAALAAKADLVGGLIPTAQIPALALTTAQVVASQAAMLALTASQVQPGDLAVRTDGAGTFILTATDPSQLSSWTKLNSPTDLVTSVAGQVGTVVLAKSDVGLSHVDDTSDANKPVSVAQAQADALAAQKSANLSDLPSPAAARTNLGLPGLYQALGARAPLIDTIPYAATITPDASLGNTKRVTATGNMTVNAPTNPTEGQTLCLEILSAGGGFQVTLQTGTSQSFAFGTDITSIPAGVTGKTQRIYVTYRSTTSRWEVVSVLNGF
jgi:hypothetical protein